jgi:hypothetical protein
VLLHQVLFYSESLLYDLTWPAHLCCNILPDRVVLAASVVILQGTEQLALLLSAAAASLQQPAADGTLPAQHAHKVLNFCIAVKVGCVNQWAGSFMLLARANRRVDHTVVT